MKVFKKKKKKRAVSCRCDYDGTKNLIGLDVNMPTRNSCPLAVNMARASLAFPLVVTHHVAVNANMHALSANAGMLQLDV